MKQIAHNPVEILESRIAPAAVLPTIKQAELEHSDSNPKFVLATPGSVLLRAGQVLSTSSSPYAGSYLMFVEQGLARVFITDLNNNGQVDFNEITGIAAGDGLRLTSFVDIHGDVVTNLMPNGSLSDSNRDGGSGDYIDNKLGGDGRVLLDNRIESITLRSLKIQDINDQDGNNLVNAADVTARLILSSYSIYGHVLAGKGVGISGDNTTGLLIDSSGFVAQADAYTGGSGRDFFSAVPKPVVSGIKVGSAAGDHYFSFGVSKNDIRDADNIGNNLQGHLRLFSPLPNQTGADIFNVRSVVYTQDPYGSRIGLKGRFADYEIHSLIAGNGGAGARGGNIENVVIKGDTSGGYQVIAGNGGSGPTGGNGGAIINFVDIDSATGEVTIKSGSGGLATIGAGGDGGNALFAYSASFLAQYVLPAGAIAGVNQYAGTNIILGDGGDGFTRAGNGASLQKTSIVIPEGGVEFIRAVSGTTHVGPTNPALGKLVSDVGVIGSPYAVDIDEDGSGDFVYTTSDSNQLVLQFGDSNTGMRLNLDSSPDRLYFDAAVNAEALTVGDFNGDGHQDIATAGFDQANFGGIMVFIAKWEDRDGNGLSASEDSNQNGTDDFLGFFPARYSVLPSLADGDPDGGALLKRSYGYYRSGNSITDLAAGDFNGDGYVDLAAMATHYSATPAPNPFQLIVFLTPDIEDGRPTGQFFADVGYKRGQSGLNSARPVVPFVNQSGLVSDFGIIQATALSTAQKHDVIVAMSSADRERVGGEFSQNFLEIYDNANPSITGPVFFSTILAGSTGRVDTNRGDQVALARAELRDFDIGDINEDGRADFAMAIKEPNGYTHIMLGDGFGGAVPLTEAGGVNNAGYLFGGNVDVLGVKFTFDRDPDFNGRNDSVAYLLVSGGVQFIEEYTADFFPSVANPGLLFSGVSVAILAGGIDTSIYGWDVFFPDVNNRAFSGYAAGTSSSTALLSELVAYSPLTGFFSESLSEHYVNLRAGSGGDSLVGNGGRGGDLGSGQFSLLRTVDANGVASLVPSASLNLVLPINRSYDGVVRFTSGAGGNGFVSGGAGGDLSGVYVAYAEGATTLTTSIELIASDGGYGVSGNGGSGGSISATSVTSSYDAILGRGAYYQAGNGGRGINGGHGGSIAGLGKTAGAVPDTVATAVTLLAGSGGDGIRRGGDGGALNEFHASFNLSYDGAAGGFINYRAGDGGNAVTGPGGRGGSVVNVDPFLSPAYPDNRLSGDVFISGGNGGDGRTGGVGGGVSGFHNNPTTADILAIVSITGGNGGKGVVGDGGSGGSVSNIAFTSTGRPNSDILLAPRQTLFNFNRILSGNGGDSAFSKGGVGGVVKNVTAGNQGGTLVISSGAGGSGLRVGGDAGDILDVNFSLAGDTAEKALIVAGVGGNARAFIGRADGTDNDRKAFGGKIGQGGAGGDIIGLRQNGQSQGHLDIIAGNGGDSVNYGKVDDLRGFGGAGGRVQNISVDMDIGNSLSGVAIRSYNDIRSGETMSAWVNANIRDEGSPGLVNDSIGNVGIVVGAAGRIKSRFIGYDGVEPIFASNPSPATLNGSLVDVRANSLMSAVAGSVDRIAAIRSVADLRINSGGVGADKIPTAQADYLDRNGAASTRPSIDGSLVDGALVSANQPTKGKLRDVDLTGRIFIII